MPCRVARIEYVAVQPNYPQVPSFLSCINPRTLQTFWIARRISTLFSNCTPLPYFFLLHSHICHAGQHPI